MKTKEKVVSSIGETKLNVAIRGVLAVLVTVIMVFPLYWMLATALKTESEVMSSTITFWPAVPQFENFAYVINKVPFFRYMLNTAVVTAMQMVSELLLGILAAYAFSKGRFHGKHFLFIVVLGAMMIPIQVTFIPLYIVIARAGLMNTYWGVWIAGCVSSYAIFLLRENFRSVPSEIMDAARLDGAGTLRRLWHMVLPMNTPIIATLTLITVVSHWNNFMWPSIIAPAPEWRVITVATAALQSQYSGNWTLVMAATTIALAPLIILFVTFQDQITRSIGVTGIR
jgi:multiple sugar transport system permease protein